MKQLERIFQQQIENNISRLMRKAAEHSRDQLYDESPHSLNGSQSMLHSRLSLRTTDSTQADLLNIGDFETMAKDMAKSVLRRLEQQTASWGLPDEDTNCVASNYRARCALLHSAEARHQELLSKLQEKRREEEQMHARLLRDIIGSVDAKLRTDEPDFSEHDSELQREFLDQLTRIKTNIAMARKFSSALEEKRRMIEGIEARQRQPLPPVDAWLAGEARDGLDTSDAECQELRDAITLGEQHCKRLRRHLP